jgi:hypothetical protein
MEERMEEDLEVMSQELPLVGFGREFERDLVEVWDRLSRI